MAAATWHRRRSSRHSFSSDKGIYAPTPRHKHGTPNFAWPLTYLLCRSIRYSAWLAEWNISFRTIKSYLSALLYLQILNAGVATHRWWFYSTCQSPRSSYGGSWDVDFNTVMLWAVACTCFFGFLRSEEATLPSALAYDPGAHSIDVLFDSRSAPSKILVRIKASKTDPFRLGVTICLGRTGRELCPEEALLLGGVWLLDYEDEQPLTIRRSCAL